MEPQLKVEIEDGLEVPEKPSLFNIFLLQQIEKQSNTIVTTRS